MKTLKLLFALCIILVFTSNAVNAQAEVSKEYITTTAYFDKYMDEAAIGEVRCLRVQDGNKIFALLQGELIGKETGNIYTYTYVINLKDISNENNYQEESSRMFILLVHCNNKLIGRYLAIVHMTINANGELTAYFNLSVDW
jgi:hypothetical protein